MAKKGISTRSEALEYDDFVRLIDGLHANGEYRWELFCLLSYNFALRISDVLNMRWEDILGRDRCTVTEIKTGKTRGIPIEPNTHDRIVKIYSLMGTPHADEYVFFNAKSDKIYSPQYVNKKLKEFKVRYRLPVKNFSSHSFRKTFGRRVYKERGQTEHAIVLINRAFQHRNIGTTLIYLGLYQDELDEIYKEAAIK
jgi:integrase